MSALNHPNIVKVHASENKRTERGVEIMVVMEYCPGACPPTKHAWAAAHLWLRAATHPPSCCHCCPPPPPGGHLLARINKQQETGRPLPYEKVLEVFANVARPVAYLHAQSPPITHRDLKFENVLIALDGSLRLCDFGSASTHSGVPETREDRAACEDDITRFTTPHFRSPEMVDLYSGLALDERGDVWALGCLLYGLAYFKHPFLEAGPLAILAGRYRLPYAPAYPLPITTAIRACLQVRPDDRPTAAALLAYAEACARAPAGGPFPPP